MTSKIKVGDLVEEKFSDRLRMGLVVEWCDYPVDSNLRKYSKRNGTLAGYWKIFVIDRGPSTNKSPIWERNDHELRKLA